MHALFIRTVTLSYMHEHEFIYTCTSIAKQFDHSNMWKLENIYKVDRYIYTST